MSVARFTQADVRRAVKGCEESGVRVVRVEIEESGKIIVTTDTSEQPAPNWRAKSKLYAS